MLLFFGMHFAGPFVFAILGIFLGCTPDMDVVPDSTDDTFGDFTPCEPIRRHYGTDTLQYGLLRIPDTRDRVPVIMIIHGGCWLSSYDLGLMTSMAVDLCARGYATWNIEYRRTSDPGGGWPGTFLDPANALKFLDSLSADYPIDMDRIVVTGHSAGGHLALMTGAQAKLAPSSALKVEGIPAIRGIVSLAGITDLSTYLAPSGCGSNTDNLVGGLPDDFPDRYAEGSPITHLPLGVRQILINGQGDNIVSLQHITPYYERAMSTGEEIALEIVEGAGHFEVITPGSKAWPVIIDAFEALLD